MIKEKVGLSWWKENQLYIGFGVSSIALTLFIVYFYTVVPKQLDSDIDWNKIDLQVRTNQTLTNSWDCATIEENYKQAKLLDLTTPHPIIVKDFLDLGIKRGCSFAESNK